MNWLIFARPILTIHRLGKLAAVLGTLGLGSHASASLLGASYFEVSRPTQDAPHCPELLLSRSPEVRVLQDLLLEWGYALDFIHFESTKDLSSFDLEALHQTLDAIPSSLLEPGTRVILSASRQPKVLGLRFTTKDAWFQFIQTERQAIFKTLGFTAVRLSDLDLTASDLFRAERLSQIETLWLDGNDLGALASQFFNLFPRLKKLDVSGSRVGIATLARSTLVQTLESLSAVDADRPLTDAFELPNFLRLQVLEYDQMQVPPAVADILRARPVFVFSGPPVRAQGKLSDAVERRRNLP